MILLFASGVLTGQSLFDAESNVIEIRNGWQYRWGDSPQDENGTPIWATQNTSEPGWKDTEKLLNPAGRNDAQFLWYRIKLPEGNWQYPVLYFPQVPVAFEVYLAGNMIYKAGEMSKTVANKLAGIIRYMIPLGAEFQGKLLAIRVYSNEPGMIGIIDTDEKVLLGSQEGVFKTIVQRNLDSIILGFLFIFLGFFSLFIFFKRLRKKEYYLLSFGIFTASVGFFYVLQDAATSFVFDYHYVRYYLGYTGFLLFPVGLYAFVENIIGGGKSNYLRRLWQGHLLYLAISLVLDITGIVYFPISNFYYLFFFITTILIMFYVGLTAISKGNWEAKIFIMGFAIFGISGLHDIFAGLEWISHWHWMSHWGAFIFMLCLGYLLELRFTENHNRLQQYSKELEIKTKKLDKYSQVLEQKVAERTLDLNEKNRELAKTNEELEDTLTKLTQMQSQLITQAKMASLGNLVAGLAHELNNPIGAVQSAADVSLRCADKIEGTISNYDKIEPLQTNAPLKKATRLLGESLQVIINGGQRIEKLVRSLKNFAHLDEAEYQRVNIHEGIESTLTLLEKDLQNRIVVTREYAELPKILCNAGQVNQVFMNVLQNAVQAIDGEGGIVIKTSLNEKHACIQFHDTGKGIPKEKLENIFEFSFSQDSSRVKMGAGLSTANQIIQNHHGHIEVKSIEGKGSTFTVILPIK